MGNVGRQWPLVEATGICEEALTAAAATGSIEETVAITEATGGIEEAERLQTKQEVAGRIISGRFRVHSKKRGGRDLCRGHRK